VQQLMEAGAAGYLLKHTLGTELLKAIHEVDRGNACFSPEVARRLRDQCRQQLGASKTAKRWTPRMTAQANFAEMR
jgi:DNA-binding NarL/FixJ family response regulator